MSSSYSACSECGDKPCECLVVSEVEEEDSVFNIVLTPFKDVL